MPRIYPTIFPIALRENSTPTRQFTFYDDYGAVVDVSAYQITLIVKPALFVENVGRVADAKAIVSLNATSLGTDGKFSLVFTKLETTVAPGNYPAELVWWTGGAPSAGVGPTDGISGTYTIIDGVDNTP